jgi:hypothetical protein
VCPSGVSIGPLMFLIFINDIEIVGLGRLFADDTSIGHIAQDESTLRNMINTDLNYINKLSNRWLLKLNPTKTEIIIFNVNGVECNLTLNFDQITIDPVHTHKHLRIVFSNDCKWTKHIDKLIESASKQLNVLRKLKYRPNRNYLEKNYLTCIRPVLEYASAVWDNCGQINSAD